MGALDDGAGMKRPAQELRRVAMTAYITPSRINAWRASRREGDKFTVQQLARLADRGLDPDTVEVLEVRSTASMQEWCWPANEHAPVFIFECPVVGHRGERVMVIAPAGMTKLVWPDGSITRAQARRRGW